MSSPTPTPSFFEGINATVFPFQRDEVSAAALSGSLQRTDEWQQFPSPGGGDPGYFEFMVKVVPRVRDFVLGYSGFPGLRWLLGSLISGMIHRFRAKHLAVLSRKVGNINTYTEQVAVLNIMKVGNKYNRAVVEAGDFVMVDKEQHIFPARVQHLYMSLVDGGHLLVVQPYLIEDQFPGMSTTARAGACVKLAAYEMLVKPEEICGGCNIFEDVDELEVLSRSCDSSLFFLCRLEYTGMWHPEWMPYRNWPGCYKGCDDMLAPKQSDVHEVSCEKGQAKRWLTGLRPCIYMDRMGLLMYAAPLIAHKVMGRMAISRPHSDACIVFENFPKEAFYVAVVQLFLRKARKVKWCGRIYFRVRVHEDEYPILQKGLFAVGGCPGFPEKVVGEAAFPGDLGVDRLRIYGTIVFDFLEDIKTGGRLKIWYDYENPAAPRRPAASAQAESSDDDEEDDAESSDEEDEAGGSGCSAAGGQDLPRRWKREPRGKRAVKRRRNVEELTEQQQEGKRQRQEALQQQQQQREERMQRRQQASQQAAQQLPVNQPC